MIAAEVPASKVAGNLGGVSLMSELCAYIIERHREGLRSPGGISLSGWLRVALRAYRAGKGRQ